MNQEIIKNNIKDLRELNDKKKSILNIVLENLINLAKNESNQKYFKLTDVLQEARPKDIQQILLYVQFENCVGKNYFNDKIKTALYPLYYMYAQFIINKKKKATLEFINKFKIPILGLPEQENFSLLFQNIFEHLDNINLSNENLNKLQKVLAVEKQ